MSENSDSHSKFQYFEWGRSQEVKNNNICFINISNFVF